MEDTSLNSGCPTKNLKSDNSNVRNKPKRVIFIRGNNSNLLTTLLLNDFNKFKKPYLVYCHEKYDIKPFEDASQIEKLAKSNECPLFMFSSHNKKRPNNIVIGRLSEEDQTIKEMVEVGIYNFKSMQETNGPKLPPGPKLNLSFIGSSFQACNDYRLFKELMSDFFQGHSRDCEKLSKVDYCVKISSTNECGKFESTRIIPKYKGSKLCKIECQEMGPKFDFKLRRVKMFTTETLMDIPEETDDSLPQPDHEPSCMESPFTNIINSNDNSSHINNNNEDKPSINQSSVIANKKDLSPRERGIKRIHDDLDERLKRMKFVD